MSLERDLARLNTFVEIGDMRKACAAAWAIWRECWERSENMNMSSPTEGSVDARTTERQFRGRKWAMVRKAYREQNREPIHDSVFAVSEGKGRRSQTIEQGRGQA